MALEAEIVLKLLQLQLASLGLLAQLHYLRFVIFTHVLSLCLSHAQLILRLLQGQLHLVNLISVTLADAILRFLLLSQAKLVSFSFLEQVLVGFLEFVGVRFELLVAGLEL